MKRGATVIFHCGDKVLLQHRDDDPAILFPGYWSLFGGHIEADEKPEPCLIREMNEELGIVMSPERIDRIARWEIEQDVEYIFAYAIRDDISELRLTEGQGMAFVDAGEALDRRLVPFHADAIRYFFRGSRQHE